MSSHCRVCRLGANRGMVAWCGDYNTNFSIVGRVCGCMTCVQHDDSAVFGIWLKYSALIILVTHTTRCNSAASPRACGASSLIILLSLHRSNRKLCSILTVLGQLQHCPFLYEAPTGISHCHVVILCQIFSIYFGLGPIRIVGYST